MPFSFLDYFPEEKTSSLFSTEIFSISPSLHVPCKSCKDNVSKKYLCTARLSGLAPKAGSRHFSTT